MVRYTESLTPSWSFHLALLVVIPMGFGMLAPLNIVAGYVSAITLYAITLVAFVVFAPRIVVTDSHLRAGRATIELTLLGSATVVEQEDRNGAITDARTWKLIRAWIPRGLSVVVNDSNDPTPSWYLSTRHPEKLRDALRGN
mgnify:CR=1 FL=1|jgi:hypothetical protein